MTGGEKHTERHTHAAQKHILFFARLECCFLISQAHTCSKMADPLKEFLILQNNGETCRQLCGMWCVKGKLSATLHTNRKKIFIATFKILKRKLRIHNNLHWPPLPHNRAALSKSLELITVLSKKTQISLYSLKKKFSVDEEKAE